MTLWEDAQANLVQLRRAMRREPQIGMHLPLTPHQAASGTCRTTINAGARVAAGPIMTGRHRAWSRPPR